MVVVYALNVSEITEAQLGETIKSIPEPLKEKIMTTYTMLIEKGEKLGIEKGKLEEKSEVILSLFDEGFETPKIAKIVKLQEEEVVKILKDKEKLK
jgi:predicted transposase/invertase (TIGR01784 family)